MNPSIPLGRIAGIRIGLNWSWLVAFALIAWTLATAVFPAQVDNRSDGAYLAMSFGATVIFFVSLLLHELGHALQARREGVEIDGITLWLFGGVARLKGTFPSAGAELRIAVAGPVVTAVLGALFVAAAAADVLGPVIGGIAAWLGYINLLLLVFNLMPALPLDGGRVLRALLWRSTGDFGRATRIAADIGRGFGFLLIAGGVLVVTAGAAASGVWLAFIGWFLLQAAAAEGSYALLRDALGDLRVGDLMVRRPVTALAEASLAEFMDGVAREHRFTTYPVADDGDVVGLLRLASVTRVPRSRWERTRVRECMLPRDDVPTVRPAEPLFEAVVALGSVPPGRALVVEDSRVVGLLSLTDVWRVLATARSTGGHPG